MKRVLLLVPLDEDDTPRNLETLAPLGPLHLEAACHHLAEFTIVNFNAKRERTTSTIDGWEYVSLEKVSDHYDFYAFHLPRGEWDVIGISANFDFQRETVHALCRSVADVYSRTTMVLGGHAAKTFASDYTWQAPWLAICDGPGEEAMIDLLETGDIEHPSWITWKKRNVSRRQFLADPRPQIPLLDYDRYHVDLRGGLPISLSTGCPGECSFCTVRRDLPRGCLHRPISETILHMESYRWKNDTTRFLAVDDDPFEDVDYYREILRWCVKTHTALHFFNLPFFNLEEEDVDLITKVDTTGVASLTPDASCERVYRELAKKRGDWNHLETVTRWFHERNFRVACVILVGYPGETREEILTIPQTYRPISADAYGVRIVQPLVGSELHGSDFRSREPAPDFMDRRSCAFDTPEWDHTWIEKTVPELEYDLNNRR